ncbi:MAG: hypothetical protein ABIG70_04140 [Pseudomonadota bacterium]
MQIRIQGQKVQLIRSTYDPTLKRCTARVVVSFNKWTDGRLSAEQMALLSDDEKSTLDNWLSDQRIKREQSGRGLAILLADSRLSELADAIRVGKATELQAAAIWSGMENVAKALRAGGHKRQKRQPKAKQVRNPAQVELLV